MMQPFVFLKPFVKTLNHNYNIYSLLLSILILSACNLSEQKKNKDDKAIAKVNNTQLFLSDLTQFTQKGISKEDSLVLTKSFITNWTTNEVFYQEALNYLTAEDINFEKELEKYKKELITYKFQSKLIDDKLDTSITLSEIESYYNLNSKNFLLKNNIVKVLYVKTPITTPNLNKLKKLCYSSNPKDAEQLNSMCIQYANNYYTNNNTWLMFDDLKKEIPQLKEVPEYNLQNGKTFEFTDNASFYFLKIIEIKSKNTLSPLNFEKNNIKAMLLNERKQKLINSIKKDFFEKAKSNNKIEIYK